MQEQTISQTALGTAIGRALESSRPAAARLFEDEFADRFLPAAQRAIVRLLRLPWIGDTLLALRERQVPGIMGNLVCRTRFIDDAYRTAVADGIEQIVLLGAGLDSRALRIPAPVGVRVFEVDHPATQAWKRRRLELLDIEPARRPTLVAVDFERDELSAALTAAGYQTDLRTLFVWEGVTQYIAEDSVDATFGFMTRSSHARSRIVFTYIDRGVIESRRLSEHTEKLLAELERRGEPWRYGIEPEDLPSFLAERGLSLIEDVGAEEYRPRYLRPAGREMALFDGERVAVAEVAAGSALNEQRYEPCP